jgi:polysaccharide pyruvyl transferase WcaK-like protein
LISRNPWLQEIQSARLILSLAGGDSFSDIYGLRRFLYIVLPQFLVLALRRPLVLLPQTLGPFDGLCAKVVGRALMSCAEAVYSRDEESLRVARKLLGHRTAHLRFSPDMAFALPPQAPRDGIPEWLVQRDNNRPLVGLNVSGLLHIGGYTNDNMFGVRANYRELMMKLVLWFTREQHADVVLVSHVVGPKSGAENDAPACQELYDRAKGLCGGRLHLASPDYDHREIKYLIGRCDFFLGSRMHATIAALSQCVPAIGLAYSRKFMGVFRTVDVASLVVDLREHDEAAVLAKVKSAFAARSEHRRRLQATTRPIAEAARTLVGTLLHEAAATARQPVDGATLASAPSSRPLVV